MWFLILYSTRTVIRQFFIWEAPLDARASELDNLEGE